MVSLVAHHDLVELILLLTLQVSDVQLATADTCSYPKSPALALGLTSGLALLTAQIIINIAAGCICCKNDPHPSASKWTIALVCFVISW